MFKPFRLIHSILLISICSLTLISCEEDEGSSDGGSEGSIIGTWIFNVYEVKNCDDEADHFIFSDECTEDDCQKFVFEANGTVTELDIDSNGTTEESGTYEINGNNVTICGLSAFVDDKECITFEFSFSGNELLLVGEPDPDLSGSGCEAFITFTKE